MKKNNPSVSLSRLTEELRRIVSVSVGRKFPSCSVTRIDMNSGMGSANVYLLALQKEDTEAAIHQLNKFSGEFTHSIAKAWKHRRKLPKLTFYFDQREMRQRAIADAYEIIDENKKKSST